MVFGEDPLHSFMWICSLPISVEKTASLYSSDTHGKSFYHIYSNLFLSLLSESFGLYVCLYASIVVLQLLQLCNKFKIYKIWAFHSHSSFSILFLLFGVLWYFMSILGLNLLFLPTKVRILIGVGYIEFVDPFGLYWNFNNIKSNTWK